MRCKDLLLLRRPQSAAYNCGVLFVFVLGAFCHWRTVAAISTAFPAVGAVLVLFIPESPSWYVTQGTLYRSILLD